MYQLQTYNVQAVMPAALDTGLFTALATFQAPDGLLIGAGQPSGNYADVAGYVNIPCMDAPTSIVRISADEKKSLPEIESYNSSHILLGGFYPDIPSNTQWRAVVTDAAGNVTYYDVDGAEADSQCQQTRVKVQVVTV